MQVADARRVSEQLQASGEAAAQKLASCTAQAGQAGAHFVSLAPPLVAASSKLQRIALQPALQGAEQAFKEVVGTLSELSKTAQVELKAGYSTTCH